MIRPGSVSDPSRLCASNLGAGNGVSGQCLGAAVVARGGAPVAAAKGEVVLLPVGGVDLEHFDLWRNRDVSSMPRCRVEGST